MPVVKLYVGLGVICISYHFIIKSGEIISFNKSLTKYYEEKISQTILTQSYIQLYNRHIIFFFHQLITKLRGPNIKVHKI
jgi:hypothetical protein